MNHKGPNEDPSSDQRSEWDAAAASFDDEADHGLRDPGVAQAWTELLRAWLPVNRAEVLDAGCGTGSLSLVVAQLGHTVTGIDFSPRMIEHAAAKTAGLTNAPRYHVMDATAPDFPAASFDVIVCRHILWALPEPERVLLHWARLLRPGGRLILIEGNWSTGAGLPSEDLVTALPPSVARLAVIDLSDEPALWGKAVTDERYAVVADLG